MVPALAARSRFARRDSIMPIGRITSIRADRGFGFITDTPGSTGKNDIFFHRSNVTGVTFEELSEGQDVSFEAGQDPRDPSRFRANNVHPVDVASVESASRNDDAYPDAQ
jgi:cold shock CspA family protein